MNKKVIDLLNAARARELSAILQYLQQHYELADQGYGKLATKVKAVGIQEMKHAEAFAERVLFLGGVPTTKPDAEITKGQKIPEMLKTDMALEAQAMKMYNESSGVCEQEKDQVSKDLFEKILKEEEDHFNYFDTTKDHVDKLGAAYIATLTD